VAARRELPQHGLVHPQRSEMAHREQQAHRQSVSPVPLVSPLRHTRKAWQGRLRAMARPRAGPQHQQAEAPAASRSTSRGTRRRNRSPYTTREVDGASHQPDRAQPMEDDGLPLHRVQHR
jgi:hypothetical protein